MTKTIEEYVLDADYIRTFLEIGCCPEWMHMIPRQYVLLDTVKGEVDGFPPLFAPLVEGYISRGEITYKEIAANSMEFFERIELKRQYGIGAGETAVLAYCKCRKQNGEVGIVTSNNMSELGAIILELNLGVWSSTMQMIQLYDKGLINLIEAEKAWQDMKKHKRRTPKYDTFAGVLKNRSKIFTLH
ncbi:MAG: hypothetical protein Q7I97_09535 [Thermovirgaceae bacterium]|nr:hypothetical protein [Thermovirgaceae bacterium]